MAAAASLTTAAAAAAAAAAATTVGSDRSIQSAGCRGREESSQGDAATWTAAVVVFYGALRAAKR